MLLSPFPPTTPTPPRTPANVAVQLQPIQPSTYLPPPSSSTSPADTVLGRTPSFSRVSSHLPTRATRAISSYAPSTIPPVPHLPESVQNLRPLARSMSTRRPGLESLPERTSTLNRSASQATLSTRTVGRPMSNRYEGLSMAGGVGGGAKLRGPPPPGPPPSEPLPSVPKEATATARTPMPRRQSLLVSQRMSQLMGNAGAEAGSNGESSNLTQTRFLSS